MADFWKAAAIVILTVILGATIGKTEKDLAAILSIAACCIVTGTALQYLTELVAFLWNLTNTVERTIPFLQPLLNIAGVSILTELICLLSTDAGNASLGKAMLLLGNSVILVLALPFFESFFAMVQEILRIA